MEREFQAFGHDVSIHPIATRPAQPQLKANIKEAAKTLERYANAKKALEQRIIGNERWYKLRHWEYINAKGDKVTNDIEPTSAWLFNSLANKHADIMDNFPEPNILPREMGDDRDAKLLSAIVPVVLERNNYEETFNRASWYKLKQGAVAYGVFWDSRKLNGLGDIAIKKLDLLNLFWEPGVTDIQDGRNFFILSTIDFDVLKSQYPDKLTGNETCSHKLLEYVHDENIDTTNKAVVADWYYKQVLPTGKTILQYCKFVGDVCLYSSEDDETVDVSTRERVCDEGYYIHGQYPVKIDVLFPEEDMPTGIGYIDIMRDPQIYIDKLDQIIMTNALRAGKTRWFINGAGNIDEEEFADWNKDFIHANGGVDDRNLREYTTKPLPAFIVMHKQNKIDELKETSGNRDFNQGSSAGGVTAAAAISALQEAGNKLSRDMIKGGYRAYRDIVYMCIELKRQFYTEERSFRISGEQGAVEYVKYSNAGLKPQLMPPAYEGAEPSYRLPIFDIVVKAQKTNPFSKAAQNDLALQLYNMGFFNPGNADASLAALELMDFEGKQKVEELIRNNGGMFQQLQQLMALLVPPTTGDQTNAAQTGGQAGGESAPKSTDAATQSRSVENANTPYGEKLAGRAGPDANKKAGVTA